MPYCFQYPLTPPPNPRVASFGFPSGIHDQVRTFVNDSYEHNYREVTVKANTVLSDGSRLAKGMIFTKVAISNWFAFISDPQRKYLIGSSTYQYPLKDGFF